MDFENSTKMGNDNCPCCGTLLDAATPVNNKDGNIAPRPKDISICIKCGEILYYSDDMKLEKLPKILFDEMDIEDQLLLNRAKVLILTKKD